MTQEQTKEVWARNVALQTALHALADLPENKRAWTELKEGIESCNTELVSGTYNPPLLANKIERHFFNHLLEEFVDQLPEAIVYDGCAGLNKAFAEWLGEQRTK